MDENFLLNTPLARWLYHECVEQLPLIDYHNHLAIGELTSDKRYENLARLWLLNDPYKHRAMRICGCEEKYITGDAEDYEKFEMWMSVLPKLIGNPLYDWSVLEMKRIFGLELQPGRTDAGWVWEEANRKLSRAEYSPCNLLFRFHVEYCAPCALLTEDISAYSQFDRIAPSLRGDNMVNLTIDAIEQLEQITEHSIDTLDDFFDAVMLRLDAFGKAGCKFSDHALDDGFTYFPDDGKNRERFARIRQGLFLQEGDQERFASEILRFLSGEYAKRGWTMQLHIGAKRDTSSRLRALAGPAGGFAGIGNCCHVKSLTRMLDQFEQSRYGLPQTILFTLNPADHAVMAVLSGSYSQDGVAGKVQLGPAWWWCDHLYGMREVLENISAFGVLSTFLGMTTDSRSILSFVRHEYFRRVLCGWIGEKAGRGEITSDRELLKGLVEDICYNNAKRRIY